MSSGLAKPVIAVAKAIAYTLGTGFVLFVIVAVWLLIDALSRLDMQPYVPQCIPAPQSICAATGDEGVRL
jgi:hypothetical protein